MVMVSKSVAGLSCQPYRIFKHFLKLVGNMNSYMHRQYASIATVTIIINFIIDIDKWNNTSRTGISIQVDLNWYYFGFFGIHVSYVRVVNLGVR